MGCYRLNPTHATQFQHPVEWGRDLAKRNQRAAGVSATFVPRQRINQSPTRGSPRRPGTAAGREERRKGRAAKKALREAKQAAAAEDASMDHQGEVDEVETAGETETEVQSYDVALGPSQSGNQGQGGSAGLRGPLAGSALGGDRRLPQPSPPPPRAPATPLRSPLPRPRPSTPASPLPSPRCQLRQKRRKVKKMDTPEQRSARESYVANWKINYHHLLFDGRIGGGAFGEVKKATWNGTPVAVKMLYKADAKATQMFYKEAQLLCKLRSPSIVRTFGVTIPGAEEQTPLCIVMEFLPHDLRSVIRKQKAQTGRGLDVEMVIQCAIDIAQGIAYLHKSDPPILHRDLKPANILLDAHYRCKVADFGISREKMDTSVMTTCGTPHYMSPEVLTCHEYSTKVDIYSFAMMLFEMLTGDVPYSNMGPNGRNLMPMQIMMKAVFEQVRPDLSDHYPPSLTTLIKQCWSPSPSDRPDIDAVLDKLDRCQRIFERDKGAVADCTLVYTPSDIDAISERLSREGKGEGVPSPAGPAGAAGGDATAATVPNAGQIGGTAATVPTVGPAAPAGGTAATVPTVEPAAPGGGGAEAG